MTDATSTKHRQTGEPYQRVYLTISAKLVLMLSFATLWMGASLYIALPWIDALAADTGYILAWVIVSGIALIPGYVNALLVAGLLIDWRPNFKPLAHAPGLSILIAAYNEEASIESTLTSLFKQHYPGDLEIIVINDGSKDTTAERVRQFQSSAACQQSTFTLTLLEMPQNGGKAAALNLGLRNSLHELVATIDADSQLYANALINLITNHVCSPKNTAATAGTVLVRNSRKNLLTRLQEWDYFLGISVVKRIQSLLQGTLVAQGAFSVYNRAALNGVGGWQETVGEDIVLTWGIIEQGFRVGFAENAFAFTNVPESYGAYYRQRKRWSRGLIEAFKRFPRVIIHLRLNTPFIWLNLLFPYLDAIYLLVFIPGVIAAIFFEYYAVASIMTILLIPLALTINVLMHLKQVKIFRQHGLKVRRNILGALLFMLTYQILLAPACLMGYLAEILNLRKSW